MRWVRWHLWRISECTTQTSPTNRRISPGVVITCLTRLSMNTGPLLNFVVPGRRGASIIRMKGPGVKWSASGSVKNFAEALEEVAHDDRELPARRLGRRRRREHLGLVAALLPRLDRLDVGVVAMEGRDVVDRV